MPSSASSVLFSLSLHDALPIWPRLLDPISGLVGAGARHGSMHQHVVGMLARREHLDRRASIHASETVHRRVATFEQLPPQRAPTRSEEHTSELQSPCNLVCRRRLAPCSSLFPYTTLFRSGPGFSIQFLVLSVPAPGMAQCTSTSSVCSRDASIWIGAQASMRPKLCTVV